MDSALHRRPGVGHRRRRHVVGDRRAPGGPVRVCRCALGRVASLHRHDDLLRLRRHLDGTPLRSVRDLRSLDVRRRRPRNRLRDRQHGAEPLAIHPGARRGGGRRGVRRVRTDHRRHLALVQSTSRYRRFDHRERQLSRRDRVAAGRASLHLDPAGAGPISASASSAWRPCSRSRWASGADRRGRNGLPLCPESNHARGRSGCRR